MNERGDENTQYQLVVSKYSFLKSSSVFRPYPGKPEATNPITERELLLHFQDFSTMGLKQDAEIIPISDISRAEDIKRCPNGPADAVEHILQLPEGMSSFLFFSFLSN
jgi:hypothetical protein